MLSTLAAVRSTSLPASSCSPRRRRDRHLRQGRARRAGRRRPADAADGRADGRRHERVKRGASRSLTALLAAAIATAFPGGARACADFAAAPSTRWSLATENGVSWLVTPCGERFFSVGVNVLDGGNSEHAKVGKAYSGYSWEAFAPTLQDWAAETRRRLHSWGVNSAGGWALPPQVLELPTVINLELGRLARFHWF